MKKIHYLLLTILLILSCNLTYSQEIISAKLDVRKLFSVGANLDGGIIGTANGASNEIVLDVRENKYNVLIYRMYLRTSSTTYSGLSQTIPKDNSNPGEIYFPDSWNSGDIEVSVLAIDKKYADYSPVKPYPFLQGIIDVTITINQSGSAVCESVRIPGIGDIGINPLFDSGHACSDASKENDCPCSTWIKVKTPNLGKNIDVIVAGHRGVWGSDLGRAAPENSEGAISAARGVTPVIEFDVTIMNEEVLIGSHDYNLKRLSNYTGSDQEYLFNLNYPAVANLDLRRRDETVSNYHYLRFEDVVDLLVRNDLVVLMDIKDIRAYRKGGVCVANCEYDPNTNPNAEKLIKDSWLKIFELSYKIAKQKNALAYISYKISLDYDDLLTVFPKEDLAKVLYVPMIQPSNNNDALSNALKFTDDWIQKAGKQIVAIETNFKTLDAPILRSFSHNGKNYQNIMHYVYDRTGLRGGLFSEESCGPRGVVNRWADWSIKNMKNDMRGNQLDLINIPYGQIMLITSDRTDVWKQIGDF